MDQTNLDFFEAAARYVHKFLRVQTSISQMVMDVQR